jgi:hypothetical protein
MALVRYAQNLGLVPKVHRIDLGSGDFNPLDYDILFYGPGEISSFEAVMKDIGTYTRSLAEYVAYGKVMLVTGTTMAMFGERIRRFDPDAANGLGETIDGLCMIPAISEEREYVYGNDLDIRAEYGGYAIHVLDCDSWNGSFLSLKKFRIPRIGCPMSNTIIRYFRKTRSGIQWKPYMKPYVHPSMRSAHNTVLRASAKSNSAPVISAVQSLHCSLAKAATVFYIWVE